jgi:branched-chain amino acid transport system ATP-binding protein
MGGSHALGENATPAILRARVEANGASRRVMMRHVAEPLLQIENVSARFGGVLALSDVSFSVHTGEYVGLIGPNGAGKTTVFNVISRLYSPSTGSIRFAGWALTEQPAHQVIDLRIVRTFQNLALCPGLSVRRNVMLGGFHLHRCSLLQEWLQTPRVRRAADELAEQADLAIELVALGNEADTITDSLSHGAKRKVELARALCAQPKLLMLDEPASGLTDDEALELVALLRDLKHRIGLTIIVIEHHLDIVLALSDRLIVMDMGRVIADGHPEHVTNQSAVLEAYIGAAR